MSSRLKLTSPILCMALLLWIVGAIYSFGWSGSLHFDDEPNLAGLSQIQEGQNPAVFVFSGVASPLGRPLALATFALQAEAWPEPRPFLIVNTIIHLLNGGLVFWLALLLGRLSAPQSHRVGWFALAVAACWLASPFLASSSLMIVQRMATLAGTFIFLGLTGYVAGRLWMRQNASWGAALALSSLALCSILAVLIKENGALLPLMALVTEFTLIRQSPSNLPALPKRMSSIFLGIPTLIILAYLSYRGVTSQSFENRDFNALERLMTQGRIVWEYVLFLLVPSSASSTPFSDGFSVSRGLMSPTSTLFGLLGVIAAAILAVMARRQAVFISFGIAFFAAGHLLESTHLNLELYFAHRNYVPAFGLYFAVLYPIFFLVRSKSTFRIFAAGLCAYFGLTVLALAATTNLWGQPDLAAEVWLLEHPDSRRAAQFASAANLANGDSNTALSILEESLARHPSDQTIAVQTLNFCSNEDENRGRIERARMLLQNNERIDRRVPFIFWTLTSVDASERCSALTNAVLSDLIEVGKSTARSAGNDTILRQLKTAQAQLYYGAGDRVKALDLLSAAYAIDQEFDIAALMAYVLILENREEEAFTLLSEAHQRRSEGRRDLRSWLIRSSTQPMPFETKGK